ncbi:Y-family DNA polymerase [Psychroserpens ponticola]|uniref:Y-family DNA polymerase n=1 Tax=Psychroserpens ponticola TaxID=2932268 RepID=A0ABY7RXY3_9FLAO|nr:Y-family DNA polymerase [Psychroserpens ponticola]WCO01927.1 Y-family DNA polymerase [Psychroserpens ponticola]
MFALVDCNNFYASCERVFQPQYNNKPVAILSNNDGCVISRSDEAKALDLPMGAPAFKYESFFKAHNIRVFSSNYPLYGDMSSRVMSILEQFTPDIEVYSIDEAFLQFRGFDNYDFNDYGLQIRQRVLKWTGIPTSVGIASTKTLSKVANKIARKFQKQTNGVYVIDSEDKRIKALKWMKIESVWGIGRGLQKRLKSRNCINAYDFTQLSDEWVKTNMAIVGLRLKKELLGISTLTLEEPIRQKKAIATTRSFEHTYSDLDNLKERISTFATSCAEKLRKQHSCCNMIYVFIKNNRHNKIGERYESFSTIVNLPYSTDSSLIISKYATEAMKDIYKKGLHYKKAGVVLMGLVPKNERQLNLFVTENPKHQPLMRTIDSLNEKYESHKIKLGSQDLKRTWKMRQERLSLKYTTNINEILKVKCL